MPIPVYMLPRVVNRNCIQGAPRNLPRQFLKTARVIPLTRGRTGGVVFCIDFRISALAADAYNKKRRSLV
jgi:hypothetical protein